MKGQSDVLQLIAQGKSLKIVLDQLIKWVEAQSEESLIASFFVADESGQHLYHLAGSRLPMDYVEAINGLALGPNVGSCGTAAYLRKPVIVDNIEESVLWKDHKQHALKHNLHSCWSTPLINNEGKLRGTFAIYYQEPRQPADSDKQLISLVVHTALIAIEHEHAEQERRKIADKEKQMIESLRISDERFQNLVLQATVGMVVLQGEDLIVEVVNDRYGKLINMTPEQLLNKPLFSVIPQAEATFKPLLDNVRLTGESLHMYNEPYHAVVNGKDINGYLDTVYQPYKDADGTITGVMALCHDVTEVVLSRKKQEESEQQFRNLVMQAPVAIAVFKGKDFVAEIVNDSYMQLIVKTRDEFIGKPLFESLPEIKQLLLPVAQNLMQTGESFHANELEVYLNRKGEMQRCFFNSVWEPYYEMDGSVGGFVTVSHEVTAQVEARLKVEESEQQIRSLVEGAPFPIGVFTGREMRIQFANQSLKDVWGKGNEVEGKLYAEVLPELATQNIYHQLDKVYITGVPYHAKRQRMDLLMNGRLQPFYFNYSFTPLYNTNGEVYAVMNTGAEVTELVTAYKELEESEARARLAIEVSDQGKFDINLRTEEAKLSRRLTEIFDLEENAKLHHLVSTIHPDDLLLRKHAYERAYQTSLLDYDARIVKKNGSLVWVRIKGKIYFSENGEPDRLLGIAQDITEQKNFANVLADKVAERTAELEDANKQLLLVNEELQQFAYISSHDLQEPLRKIRVFGGMLTKSLEGNDAAGRLLQKIHASAERMSGLIQSLLEYAKVANTTFRFEELDLNKLLQFILTDYELLIEQKGATIDIDRLPTIEAVPFLMNQLFFNLIGNALKFTKRGVAPFIQIKAAPLSDERRQEFPELSMADACTVITVQDNGIGFDPDFASKIFTVFQRLNDQSSYGGYGIGLALCKKVIQLHGGVILAEAELNKGATFTVILPIERQDY